MKISLNGPPTGGPGLNRLQVLPGTCQVLPGTCQVPSGTSRYPPEASKVPEITQIVFLTALVVKTAIQIEQRSIFLFFISSTQVSAVDLN